MAVVPIKSSQDIIHATVITDQLFLRIIRDAGRRQENRKRSEHYLLSATKRFHIALSPRDFQTAKIQHAHKKI